jgi:hypothetical protein
MDDEEVVIRPAHPTRKTVVLQPNAGVVGFAVIFYNVLWHPKALQETHVTHITPEHLGPWPLEAEVVPLSIIAPTVTRLRSRCSKCAPSSPPVGLLVHWELRASARMAQLKTG